MRRWKGACWVLAVLALGLNCQVGQASGFFCCNWSCSWSCSWSCCWPCCPPCYPCYSCYPCDPCYSCYRVVLSAPVAVSAPVQSMPSVPTSVTEVQPAPRVPTEPTVVERGFSAVRRKLLLKNRGPEDAPGLYLRAIQVYGSGEYRESLDLAWAAVQLNNQDARFWYARALCERALGEVELARVSARRAAALDVLARSDSLQGMDRVTLGDRAYLREAAMGMTRVDARLLVAESPAVEVRAEASVLARKTR